MTIEILERTGRRLKRNNENSKGKYSHQQIETAIMQEIGVHPATIRMAIQNMLRLKIISRAELGYFDLDEEKIGEADLFGI